MPVIFYHFYRHIKGKIKGRVSSTEKNTESNLIRKGKIIRKQTKKQVE